METRLQRRGWIVVWFAFLGMLFLRCRAEAWEVITHQGRSYVDIEELAQFYGMGAVTWKGADYSLEREGLRLSGARGTKGFAINGLNVPLCYPAIPWGEKTLISVFDLSHTVDAVLRPPPAIGVRRLRTIVIDPAHGGSEAGVQHKTYGDEKERVLQVASQLGELLVERGYRVVFTRDGDDTVAVRNRVSATRETQGEAIFLSLHADASRRSTTRGSTTVILPPAGTPATGDPAGQDPDVRYFPGNLHDGENMALSLAVQGALSQCEVLPGRGIRRERLPELTGACVPAVAVHLGYLTNKEDAARLADFENRGTMAAAIADGVARYATYLSRGAPPVAPADRRLAISNVVLHERDVEGGEIERSVRVSVTAAKGIEIDPSQVEVGVYFIDIVGDGHLEPTVADPPDSAWLSPFPDWKVRSVEDLEVVCRFPRLSKDEREIVGEREFYGIAVRILYNGEIQDEAGAPERLGRCLYQFFTLREP